jgi:hypothetical protein
MIQSPSGGNDELLGILTRLAEILFLINNFNDLILLKFFLEVKDLFCFERPPLPAAGSGNGRRGIGGPFEGHKKRP